MEPVRNHRNKTVVEAARLHRARHRRETGRTLVEGPALLRDTLAAGATVHDVFGLPDDEEASDLAGRHGLRYVAVDQRALQRLAGTETPRGPVAVVEIPEPGLNTDHDLVVSWGVSDPGNVGALVRTAAAFGWGFAYVEGTADPWSPKTLRAGAAGQFQTDVSPIAGLDDLDGWTTLASVARGGEDLESVAAERVALLIGEEAAGLPEEISAGCTRRLTIPMTGPTESLNAAVAAGIMVYALSKRQGQAGDGV